MERRAEATPLKEPKPAKVDAETAEIDLATGEYED